MKNEKSVPLQMISIICCPVAIMITFVKVTVLFITPYACAVA